MKQALTIVSLIAIVIVGAISISTTSSTFVYRDSNVYIADIKATDSNDVSININHQLGSIPEEVVITPLLKGPADLSNWAATTIDRTKVTFSKDTTAASESASNQVRVIIRKHRQ